MTHTSGRRARRQYDLLHQTDDRIPPSTEAFNHAQWEEFERSDPVIAARWLKQRYGMLCELWACNTCGRPLPRTGHRFTRWVDENLYAGGAPESGTGCIKCGTVAP